MLSFSVHTLDHIKKINFIIKLNSNFDLAFFLSTSDLFI